MTKDTKTFGREVVLEELRRSFEFTFKTWESLDSKIQNSLGFSGLFISLLGFTKLDVFKRNVDCFFLLWSVVLIMVFISIFIISFNALSPKIFQKPISTSWDELTKKYFLLSDESNILEQTISDYIKFDKKANKTIKMKGNAYRIILILIFIELILILVSVAFSL